MVCRNSLLIIFFLVINGPLVAGAQPSQSNDLCAKFIDNLSPDFKYGYLSVNENWNTPDSKKIKIFYYYDNVSSGKPVLFFNGGPGGKSWGMYKKFLKSDLKEKIKGIFLDQRGNGCSDSYPETTALRTLYSSRSIVRDAEQLRIQLLGPDKKWSVFGQSYGSLLVHRYIQFFADKLEWAGAHGFALLSDSDQYRYLYKNRVLSLAREYFDTFPEDRTKVLPDAFFNCSISSRWKSLLFDKEKWTTLHQSFQNLIASMECSKTVNVGGRDTTRASEVIARIDYITGEYNPSDPYNCVAAVNRLQNENWKEESIFLSPCYVNTDRTFDAHAELGKLKSDAMSLDSIKSSLVGHPSVRFFLYSGAKDIYSPPQYFSEEASVLQGNVIYRKLKGGHFDYFEEPQIWKDLLQ